MFIYKYFSFFSVLAATANAQSCDIKLCNYEGQCIMQKKKLKCVCVKKRLPELYGYYKGKTCETRIDNCDIEGCLHPSHTCHNRMAGIYCDCPENLSGQLCELKLSKKDNVDDFNVMMNRIVLLGKPLKILTFAKSLGNIDYTITYNSTFVPFVEIDFKAQEKLKYFKYSSNLIAEAERLDIQHASTIPFTEGYFRVDEISFYTPLMNEMLQIVRSNDYGQLYRHHDDIWVSTKHTEMSDCVPQTKIPNCDTPDKVLPILFTRTLIVDVELVKRCAKKSELHIHARVMDPYDKILHHDQGRQTETQVKFPAYFFNFPPDPKFPDYFLLDIDVEEKLENELLRSKALCYIKIVYGDPKAIIEGGDSREVGEKQPVTLDGSKSRNFRYGPDQDQHLKYKWDCQSSNFMDRVFCIKGMSNEAILKISAGKLELYRFYLFVFTVTSENDGKSDSATLKLTVVEATKLTVSIECVRNCISSKFVANRNVELQAICKECEEKKDTKYFWKSNGQTIGDKELLTYKAPDVPDLDIALEVQYYSSSGSARTKLKQSSPPAYLNCTISPKKGFIYKEEFHIICTESKSVDPPLTYEYWAGTMLLDRTTASNIKVRISNKVNAVRVNVCNSLGACLNTTIEVSLEEYQVPKDKPSMGDLLKDDKNNIKQMIANGQRQEALALTNTLLKNTTDPDVLREVVSQLKTLNLDTLDEVEQFTEIIKNVNEAMHPLDSKKAEAMSDLFRMSAQGIQNIINDKESKEITSETFLNIANQNLELAEEFSQQIEDFQTTDIESQVSSDSDSLEEHFGKLEKFNESSVEHIEEWAKSAKELNKIKALLGQLAVAVVKPNEDPLVVGPPQAQTEVRVIDESIDMPVKTNDSSLLIDLKGKALEEVLSQLHSKQIVLQMGTLDKNPYWWYPGQQHLATKVSSFSAFSNATQIEEDMNLKKSFLITMNRTQEEPIQLQHGNIKTRLTMPTHKMTLPPNALLVVTFTETTVDLKILLQLEQKPRGAQVRSSQNVVETTSVNKSFSILNNNCVENIAYMAVSSADVIEAASRNYTFYTTIFECVTWSWTIGDPQWTSDGCIPVEENITPEMFACRCSRLPASSNFAGKAFTARMDVIAGQLPLLEELSVNWYMVSVYAFIAISSCCLLTIALAQLIPHRHPDYLHIEPDDDVAGEDCDILMSIQTGAVPNAGTTANIEINLGWRGKVVHSIVITQNPIHPRLVKHSKCSTRLPLSTGFLSKTKRPLRMAISQTGEGRYPSWYCNWVELKDMKTKEYLKFRVKHWITDKPQVFQASSSEQPSKRLKKRYRRNVESLFINWFGTQPLFGPWKYGSDKPLNRAVRTFIWVSKVLVIITIISLYFGPTTLDTYERDRDTYRQVDLNMGNVLTLTCFCFLVGILVEIVLLRIYTKKWKRSNAL